MPDFDSRRDSPPAPAAVHNRPPPPGADQWQAQHPWYRAPAPRAGSHAEPRAMWSLVLGLASFFLLPVVAAIAALVTGAQAKKAIDSSGGTKSGRSWARAGQALGVANLAVSAVVLVVVLVLWGRGGGGHTAFAKLQPGDCYNKFSASLVQAAVDKVDCSRPHETEVTGSFRAAGAARYPDRAGFLAQADSRCLALGFDYLGASATGGGIRLSWVAPSPSQWRHGNHTVVCGLQNADGSRHQGSFRS